MQLTQLITKCKKNERKAQHELYMRYKNVLFAISLKYCKNQEEAEDNLQESFITIFAKIATYTGSGSFEGWMKRITINKALDRYKKERILQPINEDILEENTDFTTNETPIPLDILLQYVQELPTRYRLVFNLYQLDNYAHAEISSLLDISEGTSKSNLHRAKLILKQRISDYIVNPKNSIAHG